jgi:hypothetical protein
MDTMKWLKPSAVRHWKLVTSLIAGTLLLSILFLVSGQQLLALASILISAFLGAQWFMIDPPDVDETIESGAQGRKHARVRK